MSRVGTSQVSYLTKKIIEVDESLSKVLGVEKGSLVSYSDMTRGIHEYVKRNRLRKGQAQEELQAEEALPKFCFRCGWTIPASASYCDRCGQKQ